MSQQDLTLCAQPELVRAKLGLVFLWQILALVDWSWISACLWKLVSGELVGLRDIKYVNIIFFPSSLMAEVLVLDRPGSSLKLESELCVSFMEITGRDVRCRCWGTFGWKGGSSFLWRWHFQLKTVFCYTCARITQFMQIKRTLVLGLRGCRR